MLSANIGYNIRMTTEKEKIINSIILSMRSQVDEEKVVVYLFGSYEKETYTEQSDIDLLIITKDPLLNVQNLVKNLYKKTACLSKDLDILGYDYEELKSKLSWSKFFNSIIDTGEVIYGKRIAQNALLPRLRYPTGDELTSQEARDSLSTAEEVYDLVVTF